MAEARKQPVGGLGEHSLVVVEQVGLREEEFFRSTGVEDTVHVVVKNHVFRVELARADGKPLPEPLVWQTTLVYDGDGEEGGVRKAVPLVKAAPVKATPKDTTEGGVILSCKLSVLTSQHEGSFFRILFRASLRGRPDQYWEGESRPIRVISKPESSTKKRVRAEPVATVAPELPQTSAEELLAEVGELQLEALELMRKLQHYSDQDKQLQAQEAGGGRLQRKRLDFGAAFQDLVVAYGRLLGSDERRRHIQHVVSLLPSRAPLHELRDLVTKKSRFGRDNDAQDEFFSSQGGGDDGMVTFNDIFVAVAPAPATSTTVTIDGFDFDILDFGVGEPAEQCTCAKCNYKEEAERLDAFAADAGLQ